MSLFYNGKRQLPRLEILEVKYLALGVFIGFLIGWFFGGSR